jgi:hypothetical protein
MILSPIITTILAIFVFISILGCYLKLRCIQYNVRLFPNANAEYVVQDVEVEICD